MGRRTRARTAATARVSERAARAWAAGEGGSCGAVQVGAECLLPRAVAGGLAGVWMLAEETLVRKWVSRPNQTAQGGGEEGAAQLPPNQSVLSVARTRPAGATAYFVLLGVELRSTLFSPLSSI